MEVNTARRIQTRSFIISMLQITSALRTESALLFINQHNSSPKILWIWGGWVRVGGHFINVFNTLQPCLS